MAAPEFLIVGRLRKAHGIRGELVVEPLTDAPAEIFAAGRRVFVGTTTGELPGDQPELRIDASRERHDGSFLLHFDTIPDRTEAERWRDRYLFAPTSELTPPAADEIYQHDLVGMRVELEDGAPVGEVLAIYELPQGLTLDVRWKNGTVMIPFRREFLRSLDQTGQRIIMALPEGLLE
jgi:16S rRNA processing protein RimM